MPLLSMGCWRLHSTRDDSDGWGAGSCNGHSLTPGFEAALEREVLESRGRSLGLRTIYVIGVRNEKKVLDSDAVGEPMEVRTADG